MKRLFRIHGDNVVECERTLKLIEKGFGLNASLVQGTSPVHPKFNFNHPIAGEMQFELLPGHGRWGVDLAFELVMRGARIRENADSLITEIKDQKEEVVLGIEYCGALPAGNQAWQRHGRAYSFAQSQIPYLIFNEVGGTELDAKRSIKASRYPNPTVPYALLLLSKDLDTLVLPIYEPAISAPSEVKSSFSDIFGIELATELIAAIILGMDTTIIEKNIKSKTLTMIELLTKFRSRKDTLLEKEWITALNSEDRFVFLKKVSKKYSRKTSDKVRSSKTSAKFLDILLKSGALDFYSSPLPISWIPKEKKQQFLHELELLYTLEELNSIFDKSKDLVIVFVTGFKPKGDDSRPDRGLTPFSRMLAGKNAELLTFLWGPAKESMLRKIKSDFIEVAQLNGLVESIVATSDFVLVDSINYSPFLLDTRATNPVKKITKRSKSLEFVVSEHDVDSVIHFLVTQPQRTQYFEGLCNPPGGDWSGISLKDSNLDEIRWTSLPRVSSSAAKRPDHVIQFNLNESVYVLAIESKLEAKQMDLHVGPNLIRYINDLTKVHPNARRKYQHLEWESTGSEISRIHQLPAYSAAAFRFSSYSDMKIAKELSNANLVIGVEISVDLTQITIHLEADNRYLFLVRDFKQLITSSSFRVKIQE